MGQKVNPHGLRLGFNKNWNSHWFSEDSYAHALQEDAAVRTVINTRYPRSGIDTIMIFRNRGDLAVTIRTSKPGVIIGRSGAGAQELKSMVERAIVKLNKGTKPYTIRISIAEVKSPELSAKIVAENIAGQIERRISPRRVIKQAIERTMERRAKGIKIKVSGRLNGAEIARSEGSSNGSIPLQTLRSDINFAMAEAKTTFGVIGIKVWIYLGQSGEMPEATLEQAPSRTKAR